jgi:hypothetical protein
MPKVVIPANLLEFPAIKAWRELRPEPVQPEKIEILSGRKETARKRAYRLAGVGPEGSAVIAKWRRRAKALIEHAVYEEVLRYLPIPTMPMIWMRHYMETMAYAMQVAGWMD